MSASMEFFLSVGMRSVTDCGTPLLYVTGCTSPVNRDTSRHRAWLTVMPTRNECAPVTYDAAIDSVNSFEKWSAGLFQAFAILPVLLSEIVTSGTVPANTSG